MRLVPPLWFTPLAASAAMVAAAFAVLSAALSSSAHALQLRISWNASVRGILSAVPIEVTRPASSGDSGGGVVGSDVPAQREWVLATAGHDGGTVRFWRYPFERNTGDGSDGGDGDGSEWREAAPPIPAGSIAAHSGSIFSLVSRGNFLLSGSFDRSAALQSLSFAKTGKDADDENYKSSSPSLSPLLPSSAALEVDATLLGTLPEHTGWVRGVEVVGCGEVRKLHKEGSEEDPPFLLSIGCNFVNVWECPPGCPPRRLARLDAGPSPGDSLDESFRRHDILCMAVVYRYGASDCVAEGSEEEEEEESYIVTGMVDGTLRAFRGTWNFWRDRAKRVAADALIGAGAGVAAEGTGGGDGGGWSVEREAGTETKSLGEISSYYDATGSCASFEGVQDDIPIATVARAHDGRVTGVHAIPDSVGEFVSVGYDGRWRRWELREGGTVIVPAAGGMVRSEGGRAGPESDVRICSSTLAPSSLLKKSAWDLIVGTNGGNIYHIPLEDKNSKSECTSVWRESGDGVSVTALTSIPWHENSTNKAGGSNVLLIAGTSDGKLRIFS